MRLLVYYSFLTAFVATPILYTKLSDILPALNYKAVDVGVFLLFPFLKQ